MFILIWVTIFRCRWTTWSIHRSGKNFIRSWLRSVILSHIRLTILKFPLYPDVYEQWNMSCPKKICEFVLICFKYVLFLILFLYFCRSEVPLHVRECVRCHTSDWIAVQYHYRSFSASSYTKDVMVERQSLLQTVPRQDYEVDIDPQLILTPSEELTLQVILIDLNVFLK